MQKLTLVTSTTKPAKPAKPAEKPAPRLYAIIGTGTRQTKAERDEAIRRAMLNC